MNTDTIVKEGGCRCGRVRLKITKRPLLTMACHCKGCQRMSSSAFSLSAAIPTEGFEVTKGEPVIGGLHADPRHYFCGWCMSWMFTRLEGADWFVNLRSTMQLIQLLVAYSFWGGATKAVSVALAVAAVAVLICVFQKTSTQALADNPAKDHPVL